MLKTATNYNEFMKALDGKGDIYVFRGQAFSNYVLIPSGLRGEHINEADSQMFKFVDELKSIFGFDELTCVEIAQHFQLPTRMLDFSYSYDVALFFACSDRHERHVNYDGKVFIFNKSKYERILKEQKKLSSQITRNNKFLYEWLQRYIDNDVTNVANEQLDMPIFVDATQQFDRLYMQKGLFLLWGNDESCFEEILRKSNIDFNDLIETITIPKEYKSKILEELEKKNITADTLYMNVDRIKNLVSEVRNRK